MAYMQGFGNHFTSEALPGALPVNQNAPQKCPMGLYAEQLSGTAFTVPRVHNQRSWLYRIRPSVIHTPFERYPHKTLTNDFGAVETPPSRMRWLPFDTPETPTDFVDGLCTIGGAGDTSAKTGMATHMYLCNKSMENKAFCNADGDLLFVPQQGTITITTEFGVLEVAPGWIAVVQRGMRFSVAVEGPTRGYICEVYDGHFRIPDLGPIGANGLANPRDFQTPVAAYVNESPEGGYTIVHKFLGKTWALKQAHSPFDVVAWHGNYAPYRYDLSLFNAMNTVTYDHPDPSIFTVLTCPTAEPGVAACDFVIFPPRWAVGEHTFRPPYYHRNLMSEFMGLVRGVYEAKQEGFLPGGGSLHSNMSAHGPDRDTFVKASNEELKAVRIPDTTLAFMFESTYIMHTTEWSLNSSKVDKDYYKAWASLECNFTGPASGSAAPRPANGNETGEEPSSKKRKL